MNSIAIYLGGSLASPRRVSLNLRGSPSARVVLFFFVHLYTNHSKIAIASRQSQL